MEVWRERMRAHRDAAYVHLIVNERREAGASLPHTHSQLYALEFVPAAIARERERFGAYATRTMGGEPARATSSRRRSAGASGSSRSTTRRSRSPRIAGRVPFQLMIAPRTPRPRFEDAGPLAASLLHDALGRLARVLGASPPPTCGCGPRPAAPSTSAGGSTSCRGSRTWPGSSSARA